jgi:RNA polymerase sigma-70 factor, ECF subfamily
MIERDTSEDDVAVSAQKLTGHVAPTPPAPPDAMSAILARAATGDNNAWRELIGLYGPRVFAMAQSRCHDAHVAEEIAQAVFATAALKVTGGEYREQGRFESWLFRVTMNRVRDVFRRVKRRGEHADTDAMANLSARPPQESSANSQELVSLRSALDQLSQADREVVELRHHAQLSFKQISDILDEPLGTLLARHHRALKKLKEIMEMKGPPSAFGIREGDP